MFTPALKEDETSRKKRKEEAKLAKRKRIEESGGIRPRQKTKVEDGDKKTTSRRVETPRNNKKHEKKQQRGHRFGRVMETVPCRNKPRFSTLSMAIPGSIVSNAQTKELKTHLVGQIARAASIYHVDEIIVFDDKLSKKKSVRPNQHKNNKRDEEKSNHKNDKRDGEPSTSNKDNASGDGQPEERRKSDSHLFMARVLQYCECPQYMRRFFFPMHNDLHFAGLLPPLDAPHHVRVEDRSPFREGLVMTRKSTKGNSMVNCGIFNRPVEIDRELKPGIRCTVKIDVKAYGSAASLKGTVVSPSTPRETDGTYWGYTTRMAESLSHVFENCPFSEEGYDLKIGTSERGDSTVDDKKFHFPKKFRHALIVFGGVAGIEECVDADEQCKTPGSNSRQLFDVWVNICPFQGSRTIRTEEAVMISLSRFSPHIMAAANDTKETDADVKSNEGTKDIQFSDTEVSDESDEASDA